MCDCQQKLGWAVLPINHQLFRCGVRHLVFCLNSGALEANYRAVEECMLVCTFWIIAGHVFQFHPVSSWESLLPFSCCYGRLDFVEASQRRLHSWKPVSFDVSDG